MDDLAGDEVVGEVEQAAHERRVLRDDLAFSSLLVGRRARCSTKPPFEPTGTMTAFFTICAFIRPRISVR